MASVPVTIYVEAKDEYADGEGRLPVPGEVVQHLGDILADVTRGDFELPWRGRSRGRIMIPRCPCGDVATHQITVTVVPVGATIPAVREPNQESDIRWGYFSAKHVMTLASMRRQYARIGLDVTSYEIKELIDP